MDILKKLVEINIKRQFLLMKKQRRKIKIRDLIRSITKNSDDYDKKYMKIKFNTDVELTLNKMIKILSMIVVVRAVFS